MSPPAGGGPTDLLYLECDGSSSCSSTVLWLSDTTNVTLNSCQNQGAAPLPPSARVQCTG